MRRSVTIASFALTVCAPALAQTAPQENDSRPPITVTESNYIVTVTDNRTHISCRMPTALPGSRLGPVCLPSVTMARYPDYGRPGWRDPAQVGPPPGSTYAGP
jgi:hypothetical protein